MPYWSESVICTASGVVDSRHFFVNADLLGSGAGISGDNLLGKFADIWIEWLQDKISSKNSYFSYEDLYSNRLGRDFGQGLNNQERLSVQYARYMESLGAKRECPAEVLALMPDTPSDFDPGSYLPSWKQNFDGLHGFPQNKFS